MRFLKTSNPIPLLIFVILLIVSGCSQKATSKLTKNDYSKDVEVTTNIGNIVIRLYDDTPLHKENFLKLVKQEFYDSILFHRVIENFMVQAGDPDSRSATEGDALGETDLPYQVPAEINTIHFHKRGALGAARDGNPARASSSTQFYIVHGKTYTDSLLAVATGRINNWLAYNQVVNDPKNKEIVDLQNKLRENNTDSIRLVKIGNQLDSLAMKQEKQMTPYQFPPAHEVVYKTVGGAAHLDQNYTVFGEVIQGMDIIDTIAESKTNSSNRPLKDIRIIKARLIEQQ